MAFIMNPFELGSEVNNSDFSIPNFTLGKYMVLKIVPPKGKTVRDGLVMSAALLSFTQEGKETKTVIVTEGTSGYEVTFPLGKRGILATKYRGPKSIYKFINSATKKFYQISSDKFTLGYIEKYLGQSIPNWVNLSQVEKDQHIDEYYENMYMFGLSNDFAFNDNENLVLPKPGMVTNFYRRYTPPAEGEKYGNIIITKWPKKSNPVEAEMENLDGSYIQRDEAIAVSIQNALRERAEPTFDPLSFDPTDELDDNED